MINNNLRNLIFNLSYTRRIYQSNYIPKGESGKKEDRLTYVSLNKVHEQRNYADICAFVFAV